MNHLLIITQYFPPEIGAASNRIFYLAEGLKRHGFNVTVTTTLPNYPTGKIFKDYKGKTNQSTTINEIKVYRLWLFASNSKNKLLRLFAMLSYSFSLIWFFINHKLPKTIIVQSPPLIVAFTCMLFLKSKKRHLVLNVSDLWPVAGLELGAFKKNFSYRVLEKIEHFNYKRADLILGQSEEILAHITTMFTEKKTFLYRNYPNFGIKTLSSFHTPTGPKKLIYAGLLGIAQGVFKLIQNLDYQNLELHIYGAGSESEIIETYLLKHPELPITYHGQISRNELHKESLQYDIAIIPLLNRIYGSVPSKIFEYSKLGLPILYFGGGEGEDIIKKYNLGWTAEAGDYKNLNTVLDKIKTIRLDLEQRKRIQAIADKNFDLNVQLEKFSKKLKSLD